jgi:hypothetical protein
MAPLKNYKWKNHTFAEATAVTQIDSHTYEGFFRDDWCIGKVPHGGVVSGTFLQVAKLHFATTLKKQDQPDPIAYHADFLRRTEEGKVTFTVKDVKLGRQTSVIHISLSQDGREEVVVYITQSNFDKEEGLSLDTEFSLHPKPLPVDLKALKEDKDKLWLRQPEMPFAEFRKASTKVQFHLPRAGQLHRSVADEWIHMTTGENFTNTTIGFIADMFPMPVETAKSETNPYQLPEKEIEELRTSMFWYPTVLMNIDFKKRLPEEGVEWLFSRAAMKQVCRSKNMQRGGIVTNS